MRLSKGLVFFMLMHFCDISFAQSPGKAFVNSKITNEKKQALEGATVSLVSSKDSSIIKSVVSGKDGNTNIENIAPGRYLLMAEFIGYNKSFSAPFTVSETDTKLQLPFLSLTLSEQVLKEVSVNSKKPFVEQQLGKTIINVESSIVSSGSSALDILERSPGVTIDQSDNISLKGKQGVLVMIDGKPSQIAGTDLANLLRSMPSNTIDKIELITNPNAKYDAAGNAGIINIKLKKNQRKGANGTLTGSFGQGVYSKMSGGLTFNYRNSKINFFGSYNYSYRKQFANPKLHREFLNKDTVQSAFNQDINIVFPFHTQLARLGMDYTVSPHTSFGFVVNGLDNRFNPVGNNLSYVLDAAGNKQSSFTTINRSQDKWHNNAVNLNGKHSFDTSGTEMTVDLDYVRYWNTTYQTFTNNYYNLDGSLLQPEYILYSELPGNLVIKSLKADFVKPLKNEQKIEAGIKSSLVTADNDLSFYDISNPVPVFDTSKSNHFIYHENINALYFNFYGKVKKIDYQFGIRAEQTNVTGNQVSSGQKFDSSYLQLFPSLAIKYAFNANHEIGFTANRRIDRPTYKQLNPFKFYVDPTTYIAGNPYLYPQTTYNIELSYTYKQKLNAAFAYSNTKNNITEVLLPSTTEAKVTIQTNENLPVVEYYTITVSYPSQLTPWWNTTSTIIGYYGYYKGNLANTTLSNGSPALNINSNNAFTLGKEWSAELNLEYRSAELYGYYHIKPIWQMGVGAQKNIMKNKASIKFNVNDLFFTYVTRGSTLFTDYYESFVTTRETRSATISFTYRFGKTSIAPSRRRASGVEQEKARAGNGTN